MTLPLNSRLSALYDTNGTQKDFSFGFRVFFDPDNGGYGLEVRRQTADGYEVIPKSDYLVLPVEDNSAGVVRFSVAPSAGQQIYIAGKTPTIQQLVLTNFGRYSAESIETQFDFITAIIQEWLSALGEETRQRIAADNILTQYVIQRIDDFVQQVNQNFDDKSQEIEDYISTIMPSFTQTLRDEIEAFAVAGMQDAIDQTLAESKAEIDDAVARANAAALAAAITGKVYDTPEAGIDPVTGVGNGAYYNVRSPHDDSFLVEYQNIGGVPVPSGKAYPSLEYVRAVKESIIDPDTGDAVASKLKDESGLNQQQLNNGVESIADLLAIPNPKNGNRVYVKSYYAATNFALLQPYKGGGDFIFNSSKSAVNNGVTVFNGWERLSDDIDTYKAGLMGDGVTDDLAAIRNYVMFLANNGGGKVIFSESALGYKFSDAIYVVSDVSFEINSQKLIGTSGKSLFKTAKITSGTYVPITSFNPNNVIINSQISNATIDSSSIAFDLRSFTLLCSVKNIQFQHCSQGFVLHDCFYSRWENIQATPTSGSIALPFYHLAAANNAMVFDRVSATVEWGWLIEGGSTALQFNVCTFEGGSKGYVLKGDVLGCSFNAGYYEAVTGTLFDLSQAGTCVLSFESNYINGVDIIFQDGGTGTLFGDWESSNIIVNIGADLGTGFTFRGLMNVSSARNYIKFNLATETGENLSSPTNWNLSKASDFNRVARWNADGGTDIRAVADVHNGVIPVKFSGDFGVPFLGSVPYCVKSTIPTGAAVSLTIDTQLKYQPLSLFAKVILEFRREVSGAYSLYQIYGDIFGAYIDVKGGTDPATSTTATVTLVNNNGNLRLTIGNLQNPNGDLVVTGTIRAVS